MTIHVLCLYCIVNCTPLFSVSLCIFDCISRYWRSCLRSLLSYCCSAATIAFSESSGSLTDINRHLFPPWSGMRGKAQRISCWSGRCLKHGVLLYAISSRPCLYCKTTFPFTYVIRWCFWIPYYCCFKQRNLPLISDVTLLIKTCHLAWRNT